MSTQANYHQKAFIKVYNHEWLFFRSKAAGVTNLELQPKQAGVRLRGKWMSNIWREPLPRTKHLFGNLHACFSDFFGNLHACISDFSPLYTCVMRPRTFIHLSSIIPTSPPQKTFNVAKTKLKRLANPIKNCMEMPGIDCLSEN